MDPIDEQRFAFVICIYQKKAGDKATGVFGQGTGCAAAHKVVHMLLYYKNLIGMNIKIINANSSEFPAKCPCVLVYIYLCKFYQWLLSGWFPSKLVKVWLENRNYFYLRQSWSNFDQVRQIGVYTIKVSIQSQFQTLTKLTLIV